MKKKIFTAVSMVLLSITITTIPVLAYSEPNFSSNAYIEKKNGGINPMDSLGEKAANCTFYLYGRVYEKLGITLESRISKWYTSESLHNEPHENSIALWGVKGNIKHVAFVEEVEDNIITYTEGGYKGGYNSGILKLEEFKAKESDFFGFAYLGDSMKDEGEINSNVIEAKEVKDIKEDDATPYGYVSYKGNKPEEIGIMLGKTEGDLQKKAFDVGDEITNTNPFEMWFELKEDYGVELEADTTYYYKFYLIQDGKESYSETKNFTTLMNENQIQVETLEVKNITERNAIPYGYISYQGKKLEEIGVLLGKSEDELERVAYDEKDSITNAKNFSCWFDLRNDYNITLEPNTFYYFQIYAIQEGKEVRGIINTFSTIDSSTRKTFGSGGGFGGGGGRF